MRELSWKKIGQERELACYGLPVPRAADPTSAAQNRNNDPGLRAACSRTLHASSHFGRRSKAWSALFSAKWKHRREVSCQLTGVEQ